MRLLRLRWKTENREIVGVHAFRGMAMIGLNGAYFPNIHLFHNSKRKETMFYLAIKFFGRALKIYGGLTKGIIPFLSIDTHNFSEPYLERKLIGVNLDKR